ncbi:hypothetical protein [Methylobacterium sp. B4]|uniref:hypothetical protein n=1 Tax=Methylobacterium sp. B4 TaxID=1938755 RepID=UPI000D7642A3|nr:hypothetical protein [Methylobacterium sp. B4]PXW66027.1 hypothetical protein BY998_102355 [Methylobacterium sp. B4]
MFASLFPAGPAGLGRHPSRRRRSRAAASRLDQARHGFERSLTVLRRAALDHIDSQDLASLTLRRFLDHGLGAAGRPTP